MADFYIGESLVGEGNEVAHIDLVIGSKTGPAGVGRSTSRPGMSGVSARIVRNLYIGKTTPPRPARGWARRSTPTSRNWATASKMASTGQTISHCSQSIQTSGSM